MPEGMVRVRDCATVLRLQHGTRVPGGPCGFARVRSSVADTSTCAVRSVRVTPPGKTKVSALSNGREGTCPRLFGELREIREVIHDSPTWRAGRTVDEHLAVAISRLSTSRGQTGAAMDPETRRSPASKMGNPSSSSESSQPDSSASSISQRVSVSRVTRALTLPDAKLRRRHGGPGTSRKARRPRPRPRGRDTSPQRRSGPGATRTSGGDSTGRQAVGRRRASRRCRERTSRRPRDGASAVRPVVAISSRSGGRRAHLDQEVGSPGPRRASSKPASARHARPSAIDQSRSEPSRRSARPARRTHWPAPESRVRQVRPGAVAFGSRADREPFRDRLQLAGHPGRHPADDADIALAVLQVDRAALADPCQQLARGIRQGRVHVDPEAGEHRRQFSSERHRSRSPSSPTRRPRPPTMGAAIAPSRAALSTRSTLL